MKDMKRLAKDDIILDLKFLHFDTSVNCIKGKLTAKVRKSKTNWCIDVLDLIHTNILLQENKNFTYSYMYR